MNRNGRCRWPLSPLLLLCVGLVCAAEAGVRDVDGVGVMRTLLGDVLGSNAAVAEADTQPDGTSRTGRTFGVKRIQFMIMPMVYKMGVIMTMLTVLTVISLKGLVIGLILLVLKLSAIFGKLYAGSAGHSGNWSPPAQPVHVHLHNGGGYAHQAYHSWDGGGGGHTSDDGYYYRG